MKIKRKTGGRDYEYDTKMIYVKSETHKKLKEEKQKHGFTSIDQYIQSIMK